MARVAEPWRWEARGGWYAWINGSRKRLASFDEGKKAANRRLAELLAEAESIEAGRVPLVGELFALYLAHLRKARDSGESAPESRADVKRRTVGFAEACGNIRSDEIAARDVTAWLDTRPTWGPTMKHDAVSVVKAMMNWAVGQGHIAANPIDKMAKPRRKTKRDAIPTKGEVAATFDALLLPELRDLLTFVREVGCRPKEALDAEARHLDRAGGRVILPEHKTAKKTGKDRILYLNPTAMAIFERLVRAHPTGPVFLNSKGRPWNRNSYGLAIRRARKRAGVGKGMVAYGLRHLFVTDGIASGLSGPVLAELVGHADLRMLSTYTHISDRHDLLRDAVTKIRGQEPESGA